MSFDGVLGDRKLRRLRAQVAPLEVERAWAWHPYVDFRTPGDIHYLLDTRTGEVSMRDNPTHYTSCIE